MGVFKIIEQVLKADLIVFILPPSPKALLQWLPFSLRGKQKSLMGPSWPSLSGPYPFPSHAASGYFHFSDRAATCTVLSPEMLFHYFCIWGSLTPLSDCLPLCHHAGHACTCCASRDVVERVRKGVNPWWSTYQFSFWTLLNDGAGALPPPASAMIGSGSGLDWPCRWMSRLRFVWLQAVTAGIILGSSSRTSPPSPQIIFVAT